MEDRRPAASTADAGYRLALSWRQKGNNEAAQAALQRALTINPRHVRALCTLAYVQVDMGQFDAAMESMDRVLALQPDAGTIRQDRAFLEQISGRRGRQPTADLPTNPQGRIKFRAWKPLPGHRSGWAYALEALAPLHNSRGVLFEDLLEDPFAWQHKRSGKRSAAELLALWREGRYENEVTAEEKGIIPFREPWVGFLHNPFDLPTWFHAQESPGVLFEKDVWRESLECCQGLFTLSESLAAAVRRRTGVPVEALLHPTETPELLFDFQRFLANDQKKIVQVGWWLRSPNAIYQLPLAVDNAMGYEKIRLVPRFFDGADAYLRDLLDTEAKEEGIVLDRRYTSNTRELQHLANSEYDRLLSENIVFIFLYAASANNTVVECLVRATPLLVNRLPAVEEYLGTDYPLFYEDLDQAAAYALDVRRLEAAHQHMLDNSIRSRLTADAFRLSFETSTVYRDLPWLDRQRNGESTRAVINPSCADQEQR